MSEAGFPGENEETKTETDGAEKEPEKTEGTGEQSEKTKEPEGGPWIVCKIDEVALADSGRIIADQEPDVTFKLQVEADQWIKDNAEEGAIYASMRKGKIVRAKVVRKLEEV